MSPASQGGFLTTGPPGKPISTLLKILFPHRSVLCLVTQLCPTLHDHMDYSPSVHGILQARICEWVAMPSSRRSSQPRSPALQVDSLPCEPQGSPHIGNYRVSRRTVWYRRSLLIIYFLYRMIVHWSGDCAFTDHVAENAMIMWLIVHSQVISVWSPSWSVHDQPRDQCMIRHVRSAYITQP